MTLSYSVCPICGKEFETLAAMIDHVDQTYTLTRLIEEIIKNKNLKEKIKQRLRKLEEDYKQIDDLLGEYKND